jgi:hypothetical protein
MTPVTQSRVGLDGTCFRACLASILNLKESQVPDFGEEGWVEEANDFLSKHGLKYRRVPVTSTKPDGYSTIEGISPRGRLHACVAKDGELVHDPHPQDGTGRGLVEPRYYGLLEPILGRTKYERERQPDVAPVGDAGPTYKKICSSCGVPLQTKMKVLTCQACRYEQMQKSAGRPLDAAYAERIRAALRRAVKAAASDRADDRADMARLRRNTERQGGPFFMQVTEPNGREHTIPASKLRKEN